MAVFTVLDPVYTWSGSPIAKMSIEQCVLNEQATSYSYVDTTGKTRTINGLKSWSGSFSGYLSTFDSGVALNVSMTNGYDTNVQSWGFTFNVSEEGVYTSSDSNGWMTYLPGVTSWTATYTAILDDDAPTVSPGATIAELILTSSSGNTITGDATVTGANRTLINGRFPAIVYTLAGDSEVAIVGSNNIVTAVDPLTRMAAGALSITGHEVGATDVTWSGNAFYTQLSLTANTGAATAYSMNFRGTGALTTADPSVS